MSTFEFIHAEQASYSVSELCKVLEVSRSGYYAWTGKEPSERSRVNACHSYSGATLVANVPKLEGAYTHACEGDPRTPTVA